ncbi:NADP-dependent oxidoreductase domain-containing protein [Limtongia smithiae]|uniref:NADP-dependent oxidoreductase domain-containing protein n=1 Tax=Limtongia smithiae TaxID=1125753 RepID=UPI0034CEC440
MNAAKVEYKRLGKSGLRVSVPILGMMGMGSPTWQSWCLNKEQSLPILKRAYDLGVTTWDTANAYSEGESERLIGYAMKEYNIPREELVLMTKIYYPVANEKIEPFITDLSKRPEYVNQLGLSRGAIFKQVDACLERMQTDYIDLLQIHRYDKNVEPEEVMGALNDLVKSGKVRYIGASSMWAYQFTQLQHVAEKNGWTKFISMQDHYSLLYREEEREMHPYCNITGVGIIPWSPLFKGLLARPSSVTDTLRMTTGTGALKTPPPTVKPEVKEIIDRVEEISKKKGWTMTEVALVWIMSKVTSPIVGINSIARLEDAIKINGKELAEDELKYLEEPYLPRPIIGHF